MSPEERAKAVVSQIEHDGYRFLQDLSGSDEKTLAAYIASAIRGAENEAHEMDAEWCEHAAQIAWNMLKKGGYTANMRSIMVVCQAFATTIRTFRHTNEG